MVITKKLRRFLIVGGATAVLYYCVLLIGIELMGWSAVVASSLAYVLSLAINYPLHYRWSFESEQRHRTAMFRYLLMNFTGFFLNWGVMHFAQKDDAVHYLFIQTLAITIIVIWNYIVSNRWIYSNGRAA